jgi:hypothetical protein
MFNWSEVEVDIIVLAVDSSERVEILVLNAKLLGHREQRVSPSLALSTALPVLNLSFLNTNWIREYLHVKKFTWNIPSLASLRFHVKYIHPRFERVNKPKFQK